MHGWLHLNDAETFLREAGVDDDNLGEAWLTLQKHALPAGVIRRARARALISPFVEDSIEVA